MALRAAMKALATTPMLSRTAEVARVAPRGSRPHRRPSPLLAAPRSATCLFRRVFRPEARGRPRPRAVGLGLATRAVADDGIAASVALDPHSFEGTRALAKLAMLVYWNAGQDGFWDPTYDGTGLDLSTPLGFEPLIASDPAALRREVLSSLVPSEPALWLDPDPGMGPLTPSFATVQEARDAASGLAKPRPSVSRVAVARLAKPDWIAVIFRGTTPSPLRGLLREGQVNSMAGQETWEEMPLAWGGRGDDKGGGPRVHRGYAAAYRTVLAEVEGAVSAHARAELEARSEAGVADAGSAGSGSQDTREDAPPDACKVVVVGHSLGGALAALCASRLAHDPDVTRLGASVECVTFGQPRVGDGEWARGVDERTPRLTYTRVVKAGDLFARVPTSGFWLPGGNGGRFEVEYAHAGALVWTSAGDDEVRASARVGEGAPAGFWTDARIANPISVARDHAGYAYFFEKEELKRAWPSRDVLFPR